MQFELAANLSFIIKTTGEILAAMPDDDEFSPQQIRDYVAGPPEVLCRTRDGFVLFHNCEGQSKGLPLNPLASSLYREHSRAPEQITGRVFLAHPDHIPQYWLKATRSH